jgi:hypothetical protein
MISSDDKGFKSRWFEEMEILTRRLFSPHMLYEEGELPLVVEVFKACKPDYKNCLCLDLVQLPCQFVE